jgi:hydroxymethylbilane synthase
MLVIASRGSQLALWQARWVEAQLKGLGHECRIEIIKTTGDKITDVPLAKVGTKGLFTKEIEEAQLDGRVDLAVHSLKDMETALPMGLAIACILPRDDPRDALVTRDGVGLAALPRGARIGTSSLRRRAQLLRLRGDMAVMPIRGNVDTRLARLDAGDIDALVLALCGLERLGKAGLVSEILSPGVMLPAVGQGALAIECRTGDDGLRRYLEPINDPASAACVAAERAMLAALDGSCRTPIAGLATIDGGRLSLDALLLTPDGSAERRGRITGAVGDAMALGGELGARLRSSAGAEFGFA